MICVLFRLILSDILDAKTIKIDEGNRELQLFENEIRSHRNKIYGDKSSLSIWSTVKLVI